MKERKVALHTSLRKDISDDLDLIAKERGWTRPQTARHLLYKLIDSLKKVDNSHKLTTLDELKINPAFGEFERRA